MHRTTKRKPQNCLLCERGGKSTIARVSSPVKNIQKIHRLFSIITFLKHTVVILIIGTPDLNILVVLKFEQVYFITC